MIKSKRRKSWIVFPTRAGVIPIYTLDSVINKGSYGGCVEGALLKLSTAYNMTRKEIR